MFLDRGILWLNSFRKVYLCSAIRERPGSVYLDHAQRKATKRSDGFYGHVECPDAVDPVVQKKIDGFGYG